MTAAVLTAAGPIEPQSPIEAPLARDPLMMSEAELEQVTAKMVELCREDIRVWNSERDSATKKSKKPSGARIKKKQLTAQQQIAAAEVQGKDFDPFA
jgi:hypothetical protein